MGPLNDENNLQFDEKNKKNKKFGKSSKKYNIINFKTIRYKLTASCKIVQFIFNNKLMRQVIFLRLPKK